MLVLIVACCGSAWSTNRCVNREGRVTYQEQPCPGTTIAPRTVDAPTKKPGTPIADPSAFSKMSEDELRSIVTSALKDPDSARFKDLRHVGEGRALCGTVNSKNSYGGYTGFRAFVADAEGVYWSGDGSAAVDIGRYEARRTYVPKAALWRCSAAK